MLGLGIGLGYVQKGGPPFVPTDISGLTLWLRADLGVTIGTGVSAWADQSGTGDANKTFVQATGSKQPALIASDATYNNQATLSFVAANLQYLESAAWASALAQPYTVFIIGNDDGTGRVQIYFTDQAGAYVYLEQNSVNGYTANAGGTINDSSGKSSAPRVLTFIGNGASSAIYNSALTAKVTGDAGTHGLSGLLLGIWPDFTSYALGGKIAEVIVYNSALGSTDRASVMRYLGTRYGITIGA